MARNSQHETYRLLRKKEAGMKTYLFCGLSSAALISACASYPRPEENVANSMAVARSASVAGAAEIPEGQLQLKLAQEEIDAARKLMDDGEYERADYMSLRAYYDAELALALAREEAAKRGEQHTLRAAQARKSQLSQANGQD
jgi:hypothetical protein